MKIALIENNIVHKVWTTATSEIPIRYDLPDGSQLSPVHLGWTNDIYSIVEVIEFEVPNGYQTVNEPIYTVENNTVVETYNTEIIPVIIPDRVTARQFKLQLLAADLLDNVEAWIAAQDRAVQIAFEYSGTFVRDEPMMQAGFTALGFTEEQGNEFFLAASMI